jgi:uncharacterized protein (TIGR03089 family)
VSPTLTDALLGPLLAGDPARPLVTYYDDATGERIELSGTTLANWAAKTANLLRDECDLEPGGTLAVLLPAHWQTLAILFGAWWCGAEIVPDPAGADVVCCDTERLDPARAAGASVVVALSLHAFGLGIPGLPAGVVDYATEVRLHPDAFGPPPTNPGPALAGQSVDEILTEARKADIAPGSRVLTTRDWTVTDGLIEIPLAVFAAAGSLVQCRNLDPASAPRRAESEKVTLQLP